MESPALSKKYPQNTALLVGWILSGLLLLLFVSLIFDLELLLFAIAGAVAVTLTVLYFDQVWILTIALLPFSFELGGERGAAGLGVTLPTEGLIGLLALAFLIKTGLRLRLKYVISEMNPAIFCYALVCALTILISNHPTVTIKALLRDFGYIFTGYYLATRVLTTRKRVYQMLGALLATTTLLTFYGFYTQLKSGGIHVYQDIALPFFRNHCIYAAYLTMILAMALAFSLGLLRRTGRNIVNFCIGVISLGILLSFVRGAWLSIMALLPFYGLVFHKKLDVKIVLVLIVLLLVLSTVLTGLDLWPVVGRRIQTVGDTGYTTNFDRLDRWMAATEMYFDHPLLGVGYGSYADRRNEGYIYYRKTYSSRIRMGAHNLFLEVAAETGTLGLLAFLWILFAFFRQGISYYFKETSLFRRTLLCGTFGAMITYQVHGLVNNLGPSDKMQILFWMTLAMVPVISTLREKDQKGDASTISR